MYENISSATGLKRWVYERAGSDATQEDISAITEAIRDMDHPKWDTDWSGFLSALPEPLLDLIPT